jgi:hypothetical protein
VRAHDGLTVGINFGATSVRAAVIDRTAASSARISTDW